MFKKDYSYTSTSPLGLHGLLYGKLYLLLLLVSLATELGTIMYQKYFPFILKIYFFGDRINVKHMVFISNDASPKVSFYTKICSYFLSPAVMCNSPSLYPQFYYAK